MPTLAAGAVFLVASSFLASAVEMVEALTIVLAVGAVVRLALAGALARTGLHEVGWVLVPVSVAAVLTLSLRRAAAR